MRPYVRGRASAAAGRPQRPRGYSRHYLETLGRAMVQRGMLPAMQPRPQPPQPPIIDHFPDDELSGPPDLSDPVVRALVAQQHRDDDGPR